MPKQDLQSLYSQHLTRVKACELALRRTRNFEPDIRMKRIDKLLGGCGVEAIRGEWKNGYWGDVVATYVNFGDTYDTTILCLRTGSSRWECRYFISSWGDFVERYGERYGVQDLKRVLDWEQQIARQCIADLLAAGYELTIGNGGNNFEIPWTRDGEAVFAAMFQTDEEHLYARELTTKANPVKWWWVFFVHGNDGYDVINDYSSSLEQVLTNTNALVEKLNKEWEEL